MGENTICNTISLKKSQNSVQASILGQMNNAMATYFHQVQSCLPIWQSPDFIYIREVTGENSENPQ